MSFWDTGTELAQIRASQPDKPKGGFRKTRLVRILSAHRSQDQRLVSQAADAGLPVGCEFPSAEKYIGIKSQIQSHLFARRGHAEKSRDSL